MLPPVVESYLGELHGAVSRALGPVLVGLYVHGSAAMGGWNARQSDVDVLVVVAQPLSPAEKAETGNALQAVAAPGAGLESSVVVSPVSQRLTARPPFELHIVTGTGAKVFDGAGHPGDPDLVMHYAVCRQRGVAVTGPPPRHAFPEVPRPMLLRSFRGELSWALDHAPAHYAVLNACRAWAYAEESRLLSKVEGSEWVQARGLEPGLVTAALAAQRGEQSTLDEAAVTRLVTAASTAIARALLRAQ